MKLGDASPQDGHRHEYCLECRAESVTAVTQEGRAYYACGQCGATHERALIIDPAIRWWTTGDGHYWHEAAGIFVRGPGFRFLFFDRVKFPFGLTVPAGHVDAGEDPLATAVRELGEEVGLAASNLVHLATDDIVGDSCRRGADAHRWHAYLMSVPEIIPVTVEDEGTEPVWLTLTQAMAKSHLTFATRYVVARYAALLTQ